MIYFDTSYLIKCYIREQGSDKVRDLAVQGEYVACCIYGRMELVAAMHRKLREKEISRGQFTAVLRQMELDETQALWHWLPITDSVILSATDAFRNLPESVFLRTADALHLVCAREHGFSVVYSNDRHVLTAASFLNISGENIIPGD
jgi:predicted nucleic acid-binding protein